MTADKDNPNALSAAAALRRDGDLAAGEFLGYVQQSRDAAFWHRWALRALLVLGAIHVLAGIVFFFAYNWDDLAPFTKFGILQSAVVLSFLTALLLGFERPGGQAMLIAASVFTGVLFAVIGQVYQTGADAWELFAAWSVLILPWAMVSRNSAHWFLWSVLCFAAISLYGAQVLLALGRVDPYRFGAAIGSLPLLFLLVREVALQRGCGWLDDGWSRRSLVVWSMVPLFFLAVQYVFADDEALVNFVTFVLAAAALVFVYLKLLPDFVILAIVVALASLLAMAIGGRLIFEFVDVSDAGTAVLGLLLLGGWCVLVTTTVVKLLNILMKQLTEAARNE